MKIQIYTAQAGNYSYGSNRADGLIPLQGTGLFNNPVMDAKIFKILGHLYFPEADVLIWVDANITPLLSPKMLIDKYLKDNDIAIPKHPYRNCIYKEFAVLKHDSRFNGLEKKLTEQEKYYKSIGFGINAGLWECNFIIRRNTKQVNDLFNDWWSHICRWQQRDQVSFPVVLKEHIHNLKFHTIEMENIRNNKDFIYRNHYA